MLSETPEVKGPKVSGETNMFHNGGTSTKTTFLVAYISFISFEVWTLTRSSLDIQIRQNHNDVIQGHTIQTLQGMTNILNWVRKPTDDQCNYYPAIAIFTAIWPVLFVSEDISLRTYIFNYSFLPVEKMRMVLFQRPYLFKAEVIFPTASSIMETIPAYLRLFSSLIKEYGSVYLSGT